MVGCGSREHGGTLPASARDDPAAAAAAASENGCRVQEDFKKNFTRLVAEALPETASGKPIEIWFQDEARVGQQGSLEYIWAPVGSRPRMVRDNRHDLAVPVWRDLPSAPGRRRHYHAGRQHRSDERAPGGDRHPGRTRRACGPGADQAGWHQKGKQLRLPDNISLLPLPPYSPELNPMENIWDYLRGNRLSARVWDSYEAILAACKDAWNFLTSDFERIDLIAHRNWACVNL